ncbi:MAG TPA: nuclear transport factor 2 family protein [Actinomycetota bacterium]|nr:nuclear transport factor 2 family protein [Actinomycetota bacterium]
MSQAGADADAKAVAEANEEFYAAFEALDIDRMEACWQHDDEVRCIHPGWDVMSGWPRVRRSWAAIFANSAYIQFILTDVQVHVEVDAAWVTCVENILSGGAGGPDMEDAKVLATNVYRRDGGRWRMVLHHGSPVLRP